MSRLALVIGVTVFAWGIASGCDSDTDDTSNLAAEPHEFFDDMPIENCDGDRKDYYKDRWDECVDKKLYEGHGKDEYCSSWTGCCGSGEGFIGNISGGALFMAGTDKAKSKCEAAGCVYEPFWYNGPSCR